MEKFWDEGVAGAFISKEQLAERDSHTHVRQVPGLGEVCVRCEFAKGHGATGFVWELERLFNGSQMGEFFGFVGSENPTDEEILQKWENFLASCE